MSLFSLWNLSSRPDLRAVSSSSAATCSSVSSVPGRSCSANQVSARHCVDQSQLTCSRDIQSSAIMERMSSSSIRWL